MRQITNSAFFGGWFCGIKIQFQESFILQKCINHCKTLFGEGFVKTHTRKTIAKDGLVGQSTHNSLSRFMRQKA